MSDIAVQVFAKPPVPGRVKTRLAGLLGHHGCARLARAQLDRTLRVAVASGVGPVTLWVAGGPWHPFVRASAARHGVSLAAQRGADLGARMAHAVRTALPGRDGVVLLGTDCPALDPGDVRAAVDGLAEGADVALGPALDGGYYLAALARRAPVMFREMQWGGEQVFRETVRRLGRAGFRVALVTARRDLDRPADLRGSPLLAGLGRLAESC